MVNEQRPAEEAEPKIIAGRKVVSVESVDGHLELELMCGHRRRWPSDGVGAEVGVEHTCPTCYAEGER